MENHYTSIFRALPGVFQVLKPDAPFFTILDISDSMEQVVQRKREEVIGLSVFEAFPDNPDDENATGVRNLKQSLIRVSKTRQPHRMDQQRYDIFNAEINAFNTKYWSPLNTPVFDEHGEMLYILHSSEDMTSKYFLEESQALNEERFKSLVQEGSDLIGILDIEGIYKYVSPTSISILNMHPDEFIGKNAFDFIHEEDRADVLNTFSSLQTQRRVLTNPFRFLHKNGTYRWIETVITNLIDDPAVCGVVANSRDITDKIDRENTIRKAFTEINTIFDRSMDIICTLDWEGKFVKLSQASKIILGYDPEELIGVKYIDLVIPNDRRRAIQAYSEILAGQSTNNFENRYLSKDGTSVPLIWSASWNREEQLMYCIARDARERLRLEEAVLREQTRFSDMFAGSPVSMCILKGPHHIFERANARYEEQIGRNDLIGKPVREVFPEVEGQGYFEMLDKVYRSGDSFGLTESPIEINMDGVLQKKYLSFLYQPYRDSRGEVEGVFYFGVDVSDVVLARQKSEDSEKQYLDLIQNLPVAVYTTDTHGKILLYNKAAVNLWGKEPVMGQDLWCGFWKIFQPDNSLMPLVNCPMAKTLQQGVAVRGEEIIVEKPDGSLHYVLPHPSPLISADGELTGAVNVLIDISESKRSMLEKDLLFRISQIFNTGESFNTCLIATMEAICGYAGKKYAETWMCDLDNGEINLFAEYSVNRHAPTQSKQNKVAIGQGLPGQCWLKKEPVFLDNIQSNATAGLEDFARQNNLVTARAIPLLFKGKVIAVFVFYSDHKIGLNRAVSLSQNILLHLGSEIQRKKVEEEFNLLFSMSDDLLYVAGMDGMLKKLNPSFTRTLGYQEQELLAIPFLELVYPGDLERSRKVFQEIVSGKSISNYEFRVLSKSGGIIWLNVTTTTLPGKNLFFCVAKDQTEKKKAEEQLITYANRISTILESIADAFLTVDQNWNVVYWNREAERMFRTASEDIIGENVWRLCREAGSDSRLYQYLKQAMTDKVAVVFEEQFKAFGFWAEVSVFPSEEGLSVYVKDITERKNTYQKLVKTEMEVRSFARQLNHVLEDERSRIAREIHDEFGQQLAGIKMSLSTFKRNKDDDPALEETVNGMLAEVDNCMQSLRKFATELRPGILDTLGLVPSIEWLVKEFTKKTGIACRFETEVQDQKFDETLSICFFRICQEALTNILKHALASGISVKIEQTGDHLFLRIQDNGRGIVTDKLENPFSMGLLGMRERAKIIGARLQIVSSEDGTKIEVTANTCRIKES